MVGTADSDSASEALHRSRKGSSFDVMLSRGYRLGTGQSTSLGWFEITGLDLPNGTAEGARFVRSCTDAEITVAYQQVVCYAKCTAKTNVGDTLLNLIERGGRFEQE